MSSSRATWRWVVASIVVVGGVIAACSSSDDGKPTGPVAKEVARKEVGAAGGQVSGGGATIEIPEGAVDDGTVIVINQLEATAANLPKSSVLAGAVYSLLPDNVEFKKPVTVRLAIDPSKRPADGLGSLVIFRAPANTNDWTVRGANSVEGNEVVAKTTHFSWWAPAVAGDTSCFHNHCRLDSGTAREMPEFPGMNCFIPTTGPAVHCIGKGENNSAPYECGCKDTDTVLATYDHPPTDSQMSALATQCGGACPPQVQIPCTITPVCGPYEAAAGDPPVIPGTTPGWTCKTTTAPYPLRCTHVPGNPTAFCKCDKDSKAPNEIIQLNTISTPNDDDILLMWTDACGGNCIPPTSPGSSSGTGPSTSGGPVGDPCIPQNKQQPGHTECEVMALCYQDRYDAYCLPTSGEQGAPLKCDCHMNDGLTKSFNISSCTQDSTQSIADQCGFPKPGLDAGTGDGGGGPPDAGTPQDSGGPPPPTCMFDVPITTQNPNDPCTVPGNADCKEGEMVKCTGLDASDSLSDCDCYKNGVIFKSITGAACAAPGNPTLSAWGKCGFPMPPAPP